MQIRWWVGLTLTGLLFSGLSFGAENARHKEKILLYCRSSGAEGSSFKEIRLKKIGEKYLMQSISNASPKAVLSPVYSVQQTPLGTYYDLGVDSSTNRRIFLVNFRKQAVILYNNDVVLVVNDYPENPSLELEQGDSEKGEVLPPVDWNQVGLVEFLTCS